VTAISVLASIYLQAVIAGSMEDVEIFLSPLTARSKIREVLRGLVATRQVHTLSLGHAPHFYVAGTLPEFSVVPQIYSSTVSAYLPHYNEDDHYSEPEPVAAAVKEEPAERVVERAGAHSNGHHREREEAPAKNSQRHFARTGSHGAHRDRKSASTGGSARSSRRPAESRPAAPRSSSSSRPAASGTRWSSNGPAKRTSGTHAPASGRTSGSHAPAKGKTARAGSNGHAAGHAAGHTSGSHSAARGAKAAPARSGWNSGRPGSGKTASAGTRSAGTRSATGARKEAPRGARKPALAGTKKRG
jgi:hypothetical protein